VEWDQAKIIELKDKSHQQKVVCTYCKRVFVAGASCISKHFLHISPAYGKYASDEAVMRPVLDKGSSMLKARQQLQQQRNQQ